MDGVSVLAVSGFGIVCLTFIVGRMDYHQARKQESIDRLVKKVDELEAELKMERERYEADRETWEAQKLALYERMFRINLQLPNGEQVVGKIAVR